MELLLRTGNAKLKEYHDKCITDVNNIVELVRGKLPKLTLYVKTSAYVWIDARPG